MTGRKASYRASSASPRCLCPKYSATPTALSVIRSLSTLMMTGTSIYGPRCSVSLSHTIPHSEGCTLRTQRGPTARHTLIVEERPERRSRGRAVLGIPAGQRHTDDQVIMGPLAPIRRRAGFVAIVAAGADLRLEVQHLGSQAGGRRRSGAAAAVKGLASSRLNPFLTRGSRRSRPSRASPYPRRG